VKDLIQRGKEQAKAEVSQRLAQIALRLGSYSEALDRSNSRDDETTSAARERCGSICRAHRRRSSRNRERHLRNRGARSSLQRGRAKND